MHQLMLSILLILGAPNALAWTDHSKEAKQKCEDPVFLGSASIFLKCESGLSFDACDGIMPFVGTAAGSALNLLNPAKKTWATQEFNGHFDSYISLLKTVSDVEIEILNTQNEAKNLEKSKEKATGEERATLEIKHKKVVKKIGELEQWAATLKNDHIQPLEEKWGLTRSATSAQDLITSEGIREKFRQTVADSNLRPYQKQAVIDAGVKGAFFGFAGGFAVDKYPTFKNLVFSLYCPEFKNQELIGRYITVDSDCNASLTINDELNLLNFSIEDRKQLLKEYPKICKLYVEKHEQRRTLGAVRVLT